MTASASDVAPARLERLEKSGQAAGFTLERQAAFGRRKKTNRYFSFFFSCFSFFFSLAVLLGFFFVSFLVSLDLAILSSLNESCHRQQPHYAKKNIIEDPQGSIVKWVESDVRGLGHVRPRDRVFGDTFRYEILVA